MWQFVGAGQAGLGGGGSAHRGSAPLLQGKGQALELPTFGTSHTEHFGNKVSEGYVVFVNSSGFFLYLALYHALCAVTGFSTPK